MRRFVALICLAVVLGSCRSVAPEPNRPTADIRIFVESTAATAEPLVLPQSGVRIGVAPQPVLTAQDLDSIDVAQAEFGPCLLFRAKSAAQPALQHVAEEGRGRRLVLVVNGRALGARRIDTAFADGRVFIFVEVPESDLASLVAELKADLAAQPAAHLRRL